MKFFLLLLLIGLMHQNGNGYKIEPKRCCKGDNIVLEGGCLKTLLDKNKTIEIEKPLLKCETGMYIIDPSLDDQDAYTIDDKGVLHLEEGSYSVEVGKYCLANTYALNTLDGDIVVSKATKLVEIAMACFIDEEEKVNILHFSLSGVLIFISIFFLILTLTVYAIVKELRDLQGKCIICTCVCLCLGFVHLGTAQLIDLPNMCNYIAFSIYFWLIAAFFWMNIVSINIMRTIVFRNIKISDKVMFEIYSLYGWSLSLIFLIVTYVAHIVDGDHIKPGFGNKSCWFDGTIATWSYFYGPILFLILCNAALFIITSYNLWNKNDYNNITKIQSLKYRFLLYFKLFLVMGISWIFEIISFTHNNYSIAWVITDVFNSLQGLIFFLILVLFRRRALKGLVERGLLPSLCVSHDSLDTNEECENIVNNNEESPHIIRTFQ